MLVQDHSEKLKIDISSVKRSYYKNLHVYSSDENHKITHPCSFNKCYFTNNLIFAQGEYEFKNCVFDNFKLTINDSLVILDNCTYNSESMAKIYLNDSKCQVFGERTNLSQYTFSFDRNSEVFIFSGYHDDSYARDSRIKYSKNVVKL